MITILPISTSANYSDAKKIKNNKISFRANAMELSLSKKSTEIINKAYKLFQEGEKALEGAKFVKNGYEVTTSSHVITPKIMQKFDALSSTLVRMQRIYSGCLDTIKINIDNFEQRERLGFNVIISNSEQNFAQNGKITAFEWTKNGKHQRYDEQAIDSIIEHYIGVNA